jgi:predicted nucleic acid-binding protein
MSKIIIDTSVLSAYTKIQRLDLLRKTLEDKEIIIPDTVHNEIIHEEIHDAIRDKWILTEPTTTSRPPPKIDLGEWGVIQLAKKHNSTAIIDDKNAREHAQKIKIRVSGTIALLKLARQKKLISQKELEEIITDLRDKDNFHINPQILKWLRETDI